MTERLAFDCSSFTSPSEIPIGLASLFIEARDTQEIEKRIVPYRFQKIGDKVISPEWGGDDIAEYFSLETERDRQESQAGLKVRQALIDQPEGTAVIWLSPPTEGYPEGRISIGKIVWENNVKEMHCYGIAAKFSEEKFSYLAEKFGNDDQVNLDKLRSQVFVLSSNDYEDPWQVLKIKLPLGKIWTEIETKRAGLRKERFRRDAEMVVESMPDYMWSISRVRMGAYLERGMERMGHQVNSVKSGCGGLNKDLFASPPMRVLNSPNGIILTKESKGVYVKECPYCHKKINQVIFPGYKCQCGKTFRGVC